MVRPLRRARDNGRAAFQVSFTFVRHHEERRDRTGPDRKESTFLMKRSLTAVLEGIGLGALLLLAASRPAHAYLDPGTGSYALQMSVAGVLGALFSLKMFWRGMAGKLRPRSSSNSSSDGDTDRMPSENNTPVYANAHAGSTNAGRS